MKESTIKQVKNTNNTAKMKNSELLNTQSNAEENNSSQFGDTNTELIQRWRVYNTPFTIIKNEQGWFVVMGEYRLTEIFETENELLDFTNITQTHFMTLNESDYTEENGDKDTFKYYKNTEFAFLTSVVSAMIDLTLKLKGE